MYTTSIAFYAIFLKETTKYHNRIDIEQESDVLIADYSFDECNYFKEDDDICA